MCYGPDWSKTGNLYDKTGNDLPTQVSGSTIIEARARYELATKMIRMK